MHTTVDHASPRCVSRQLYKGILDGASRGVFHGKDTIKILRLPDPWKDFFKAKKPLRK